MYFGYPWRLCATGDCDRGDVMRRLILTLIFFGLLCVPANAAWIVTWETVTTYSVPCPQPEIGPDEFGRMPVQTVAIALNCIAIDVEAKEKLFESFDEAKAFVLRGKAAVEGEIFPSLRNFKIRDLVSTDP